MIYALSKPVLMYIASEPSNWLLKTKFQMKLRVPGEKTKKQNEKKNDWNRLK